MKAELEGGVSRRFFGEYPTFDVFLLSARSTGQLYNTGAFLSIRCHKLYDKGRACRLGAIDCNNMLFG